MATTDDLYSAKAVLVVGSDLSQQHPFLAFQMRANVRHHEAHIYTVTPGPVREENHYSRIRQRARNSTASNRCAKSSKAEPNLVIVFGDSVKGDAVQKLVAFGDSLGIPVKYVCLVDYSNSRGAFDMGLIPRDGGMSREQMLAAPDLDVLWVVGANPLEERDARFVECVRGGAGYVPDRNCAPRRHRAAGRVGLRENPGPSPTCAAKCRS